MIKFNIPYTSPNQLSSLEAAIKNNKYAGGGMYSSKINDFFAQQYDFKNNFLTNSCTSAIQLCAMVMELTKNDEIIIPSYTFASTPSPFLIQGAKVVLADCEAEYPNISLATIKKVYTSKTKAVMVVHYGGFHREMKEIRSFCDQENLILIEDAAQSIHSFYEDKPMGSFGDFSVFSFHETKNVNCGEGGLLVVNNESYLPKIEQMFECGTNRTAFINGKVDNYEWVSLGLSFTLSELNASFLYPQLLELDLLTTHRRKLWINYHHSLSTIKEITLPDVTVSHSNCHTFYLKTNSKETQLLLQEFMKQNEVDCYSHYYPLHKSRFAVENQLNDKPLENAGAFGEQLLRLPLHHQLNIEDTQKICNLIQHFFENH